MGNLFACCKGSSAGEDNYVINVWKEFRIYNTSFKDFQDKCNKLTDKTEAEIHSGVNNLVVDKNKTNASYHLKFLEAFKGKEDYLNHIQFNLLSFFSREDDKIGYFYKLILLIEKEKTELNGNKFKSRLRQFIEGNTVKCVELVKKGLPKTDTDTFEALESMLKNRFSNDRIKEFTDRIISSAQKVKNNKQIDENTILTEDDFRLIFKEWEYIFNFEELFNSF